MVTIKVCVTPQDIIATFPVMNQLRPKLQKESYLQTIQQLQHTDSYHLVGVFENNNTCVAVAGYRYRHRLFLDAKLEIYVDDLVTDNTQRSKGYGKLLLDWIKTEAKRLGCIAVTLDSGTQRVDAHRFYEREGMKFTSKHFYFPCSSESQQQSKL